MPNDLNSHNEQPVAHSIKSDLRLPQNPLAQVPAHHALSCKLQAYGTPFAAPDLQATADELSDADLEFAACLASPPDLEEQVSFSLGRMMSILEQNRAEVTRAVGRAAPAQAQAQTAGWVEDFGRLQIMTRWLSRTAMIHLSSSSSCHFLGDPSSGPPAMQA